MRLCRAQNIKNFLLLWLVTSLPTYSCQLPEDFPAQYKLLYEFTKTMKVASVHGVDECLGMEQNPLQWTLSCDSSGTFQSLTAELFLLPKITLSVNQDFELSVENFYFSDWNYSKVDPAEVAVIFPRNNNELKMVYTTQSARKVHLTLVKDANSKLRTLESLIYKMNIGTPSLEAKFSCSDF